MVVRRRCVVLVGARGRDRGAVAALRSVYFVGQDDRGLVTLYRGVPYELPFGIDLYETALRQLGAGAVAHARPSAGACSTTSCARARTPPTSSAARARADQ